MFNVKMLCSYRYGLYEAFSDVDPQLLIDETKRFASGELFYHYLNTQKYEKYDPERGAPSTWIRHYIFLNLNNLRRKYRPRSLADGMDGRLDPCAPGNVNFREQFDEFAGWLDMSSGMDDPEVIVQQKDLLVIAMEHFGEDNLMVILGLKSKQSILKKYNLNYHQYTKRLYRSKLDFITVAINSGYDFY